MTGAKNTTDTCEDLHDGSSAILMGKRSFHNVKRMQGFLLFFFFRFYVVHTNVKVFVFVLLFYVNSTKLACACQFIDISMLRPIS